MAQTTEKRSLLNLSTIHSDIEEHNTIVRTTRGLLRDSAVYPLCDIIMGFAFQIPNEISQDELVPKLYTNEYYLGNEIVPTTPSIDSLWFRFKLDEVGGVRTELRFTSEIIHMEGDDYWTYGTHVWNYLLHGDSEQFNLFLRSILEDRYEHRSTSVDDVWEEYSSLAIAGLDKLRAKWLDGCLWAW